MKNYIILKDYEGDWSEIFFFDHDLIDEEVEQIHAIIQDIKDSSPEDYDNSDIELAISKVIPFTRTLIISNSDTHIIYY